MSTDTTNTACFSSRGAHTPDQISQAIWPTQGCATGGYKSPLTHSCTPAASRTLLLNAGPDVPQDLNFLPQGQNAAVGECTVYAPIQFKHEKRQSFVTAGSDTLNCLKAGD